MEAHQLTINKLKKKKQKKNQQLSGQCEYRQIEKGPKIHNSSHGVRPNIYVASNCKTLAHIESARKHYYFQHHHFY